MSAEEARAFARLQMTHIGRPLPRPNAERLSRGAARYTPDVDLPGLLHVAFLRSPHAHARILSIDPAAALARDGVVAVVTGADLARIARPFEAKLDHLPKLKAPKQYPMAVGIARHQGEAVAAVVASSRAAAEDALDHVVVDWEALPAVADAESALAPDAPLVHEDLADNLAFAAEIRQGDHPAAEAETTLSIERDFAFARHTGVPLEPRAIVAAFDPVEEALTVRQSTQTPFQTQAAIAAMYGLRDSDIRVIAPDVGGSFGIKLHTYADEMAVCGIALLLKRPVKFVSDRLESFVSDIHARGQSVGARMDLDAEGTVLAMQVDALSGIGPWSVYPRTSVLEGSQVLTLTGSPYGLKAYAGRLRLAFQNKAPMGAYRAVGHPIAMALGELLIESAARRLGMDPVEIRRRNLLPDDAYPFRTLTGLRFEGLSHHRCLDRLVEMMDYPRLRAEQAELRKRGIFRGIGLAAVVELTNPGPALYSVGNVRVSAQDGCTIRLESDGRITCAISVTEQGQGTIAAIGQIVADVAGLDRNDVRIVTGDTAQVPYGGGTYGSRGAGVGGEAALRAAAAFRENMLRIAGALLQTAPDDLDMRDGAVGPKGSSEGRLDLSKIADIAYFKPDQLPKDLQPLLSASGHFTQLTDTFVFTNGFQASHLELDVETGFVRLLEHWAVEDCGRIINPMLVDEQMRGGIAQGIGAALYEECLYDEDGQLVNGSLVDYLTPSSATLPDIRIAHVETPTRTSTLGAKGAGEAGTAGAPAAVVNAINDAMSPFDAEIFQMPATPERILRALGRLA
jgi:carbon-monoxide dehydrogenase large subunit